MGIFDKIFKGTKPVEIVKKDLPSKGEDGAILIYNHLVGKSVEVTEMKDAVFAENILGLGHAIEPDKGILYAPITGKISALYKTKHAICITSPEDVELLIHIGEDTVKLGGRHFTALVTKNEEVVAGQPIMEFNIKAIGKAGYTVTTPLIVVNPDEYKKVEFIKKDHFSQNELFAKIYL